MKEEPIQSTVLVFLGDVVMAHSMGQKTLCGLNRPQLN